jgi:hypothetical protein
MKSNLLVTTVEELAPVSEAMSTLTNWLFNNYFKLSSHQERFDENEKRSGDIRTYQRSKDGSLVSVNTITEQVQLARIRPDGQAYILADFNRALIDPKVIDAIFKDVKL